MNSQSLAVSPEILEAAERARVSYLTASALSTQVKSKAVSQKYSHQEKAASL
jgi:hypothetical protein